MFSRSVGSILLAVSVAIGLPAAAIDITPTTLTNGENGVLFNRVITVTGGTPPYTELTVTDFDAGGTGVATPAIDLLTGTVTFQSTPTNDGRLVFTISVTDSAATSMERTYDVLINYELGFNPPFVVGEAVVGFGLGVYTEIANGTPPYTSLEVLDYHDGGTGAQAPVADLANGRVTGNSTVLGDGLATFKVRATDSAGGIAEQNFMVIVDSTLHFMPKTLPPGDVGAQYDQVLIAASAGGTAPCCESVSVTSFDDGGTGLGAPVASSVAGTITFSSTPTEAGTATVGVHITNAGGTFDQNYNIAIHPPVIVSPTTLPEGTVGDLYSHVVTLSGGVPPYRFVRTRYSHGSSGLPSPTVNRAAGTITFDATPSGSSLVDLEITANDSTNGGTIQSYTIFIAAPLSIAPSTLAEGEAGHPYYQPITVDGGSPPYTTFAVDAFTEGGTGLAAPVVDASAGTVIFDSTPASAGTASFSIDVVDSFGRALTKSYSIVINPPLSIAPGSLPDGVIGTSYHQVITLTGGIQPYSTVSVEFDDGGTGLASPAFDDVAGTITLNGTPTASGIVSLTVKNYGAPFQFYSFTIHPLSAPTAVVATASTPTSVLITWNASVGASAYEVARSADGIAYSIIGGTASLAFTDTTASANTAYLYRVRTASPALSSDSAPDLVVTIVFTDPSLLLVKIKTIHFTQMRTAVNAARTLAGLSTFAFANSTTIEAVHVTQLRTALASARAALGLSPMVFAHPTITPHVSKVFAIDIEELRDGVK